MKYTVHAIVTETVSIEVEADSVSKAYEAAGEAGRGDWDLWDRDTHYTDAVETY